ncbi:ATP phosphoribosyltransferase regulatory subunit [Marvinbryantia formatexigens DSM 14469]|nr:ATP phosphoribosyltransferase regulatory subunit [Marvinbryantia formatexigens]UWO24651.1 ATP phosphoribosyltransferase regulatory subunit [Marvinbryantia formatexigens DSM 14469]
MMNQRLLHTPEGVRDIYNGECERKLRLQKDLHDVLKSYGCRDIETPTFEFFDVFGSDVGTIPSRELYKFFDREGNTLVLRPDITPSIARAVSKYFNDGQEVLRLCYEGKTFINHSSYQGRLKENTHIGAEMIGADNAQADAEIIAMVVDCLKKAGLEEFQISIGQVEYFKSILKDVDIPEETECELKDFISNRNLFGVESLLAGMEMGERQKEALLSLPSLYGSVEILEKAYALSCNESARHAIARLKEIYQILEFYGVTRYISFDLSMLSRYNYYTGIFFRGYTFGTGDAVVKGGRYDNLLAHFGKNAPSIGFVVVADELLAALERQNIAPEMEEPPVEIRYTKAEQEAAIKRAQALRAEGKAVVLKLEERV